MAMASAAQHTSWKRAGRYRSTSPELRANTMANGLRIPPLGGSCRFTTPRCGSVVGFGAIPTPDIPAAVDALVRALDAATGHQG
jgi:hypothetical protein